MTDWQVDIYNRNSTILVTDMPFRHLMFNYVLNAPGACEIDCYISRTNITLANLDPGKKEIRISRAGTLVWAGYLWMASVDVDQYTVRFMGEGYYSMLRKRVVVSDLHKSTPPVNVQTIMGDLITHTQAQTNGDLLITLGAHTGSSVAVGREYCANEFPVISDSIDELASMDDGSDHYISPTMTDSTNKVFKTFNPRRGTDKSATISLSQANLHTLTYEIDAADVANDVRVSAGGDCSDETAISVTSGTSQTAFGLMYAIESVESEKLRDQQAHGNEILRNQKTARWTAVGTIAETKGPAWGAYDVGDIIELSSNRGYATFTQDMRVIEFEVTADSESPNAAFYKVTLDSVIA